MSAVFSSGAGQVKKLSLGRASPIVAPFKIDFEDNRRTFIVTHVAIRRAGNFQLLHSIDEAIYVYVFGQRAGEMKISGVAFVSMCDSESSGINDTLQYYDDNNLADRKTPVMAKIGDVPAFRAMLTACTVEVLTGDFHLGQYSFEFTTFPRGRQ